MERILEIRTKGSRRASEMRERISCVLGGTDVVYQFDRCAWTAIDLTMRNYCSTPKAFDISLTAFPENEKQERFVTEVFGKIRSTLEDKYPKRLVSRKQLKFARPYEIIEHVEL